MFTTFTQTAILLGVFIPLGLIAVAVVLFIYLRKKKKNPIKYGGVRPERKADLDP